MNNCVKIKGLLSIIALIPLLSPQPLQAWEKVNTEYSFHSPGETVIGETRSILYSGIKTPPEIARYFNVGYMGITEANPGLAPTRPVNGASIILPTSWILPEIMDEGILINLAEMRLYFFHDSVSNTPVVTTFPIGIGRSGYDTPTGNFRVEMKLENPTWYPNKSSRERNPGLTIAVPPGPDNPLGEYWIQLSLKGYGIHGTNRPESIGKRISLGCIRLFPEDIEWLFRKVRKGMEVRVINMPVKFGIRRGQLYVEVHRNGLDRKELEREVIKAGKGKGVQGVDQNILLAAAGEALGIPVPLPTIPPPL